MFSLNQVRIQQISPTRIFFSTRSYHSDNPEHQPGPGGYTLIILESKVLDHRRGISVAAYWILMQSRHALHVHLPSFGEGIGLHSCK